MKYSYSLTAQILADFNRFHWFRFFFRVKYIGSVLILALFVATIIYLSPNQYTLSLYASLFVGLFVVTYFIAYRLSLKKTFQSDPFLSGVRDIELTNDQIRVATNETNTTFKWSRITRLAETGLSYIIYIGRAQVIIVPKYVFPSEVDQSAFVEYVKLRIKKK